MIDQCHEEGIADFLPKPFDFKTMQTIFEQVFDEKFEQDLLASQDDK